MKRNAATPARFWRRSGTPADAAAAAASSAMAVAQVTTSSRRVPGRPYSAPIAFVTAATIAA
jgi:hypothetical protein